MHSVAGATHPKQESFKIFNKILKALRLWSFKIKQVQLQEAKPLPVISKTEKKKCCMVCRDSDKPFKNIPILLEYGKSVPVWRLCDQCWMDMIQEIKWPKESKGIFILIRQWLATRKIK